MLDYIYLSLYKFFGGLIKILPNILVRKLMFTLSWILYTFSMKHKSRINENLDLVISPSLDSKVKKTIGVHAFMNLLDTVFGIVKRDGIKKEEVLDNVTFKGSEIIEAYQKEKKNFILITGHYGNWELLSQSIAIKFDLSLVGVGRKIDSNLMDRVLKKNREQFNVEMLYKKGAMKDSIKVIREGKTIGILTDQAIRKNQSIDVDFLGHKATHTPLASILSRKFDLDMIPAYISTENYIDYTVTIHKPIKTLKTDNQENDLLSLTQAQSQIMGEVILKDLKQWFWMHRRWKGFINNEV